MPQKILIVGLGNPGRKYLFTRHNIGFIAIDAFADKARINFDFETCDSLLAKEITNENEILIAKPQTFMNLIGKSVKALQYKYSIPIDKILVISDDINLPFGKLRFRPQGSHGGHNGLRSIIEDLGTNQFSRLRIGVGNPDVNMDLAEYVLMKFTKDELEDIQKNLISTIIEAIDIFIKNDIQIAMKNFNK